MSHTLLIKQLGLSNNDLPQNTLIKQKRIHIKGVSGCKLTETPPNTSENVEEIVNISYIRKSLRKSSAKKLTNCPKEQRKK